MKNKAAKLRAVSALVGTIIGAGIFALPYVAYNLGFFVFSSLLLLISILSTVVNQLYVSVINSTHGDHQLPGYAAIYTGKWGEYFSFVFLILGLYGALTAYLVQGGEFLTSIFPVTRGLAVFLFWLVLALLLFFGLRVASWGQLVISLCLVGLIVSFFLFSMASFQPPVGALKALLESNSLSIGEFGSLLGVIIFAFGGTSAVPEAEEILRERPEQLSIVVNLASVVVTVLYFLFTAAVVVISKKGVTPAALAGLAAAVGGPSLVMAPLIGVLALGSSFLLLSYSLREVFYRDFEVPLSISWLLAVVPPLVLALVLRLGFISILSFVGSVGIGFSWVFVLLIYYCLNS
ncbi:MAG: aromatic amino acid transport family protein [Patescibacteria group bacterium]|nr:aromatic amino acid transport family protein [Patescibacteria group bacterium]